MEGESGSCPPKAAGFPKRTSSPLAIGVFRGLWIASTISFIGSFVQEVAERWVILDRTGSPLGSALIGTAFVTASLVGMLPAGVLADSQDRKILVVASQLLQATAAGTLAVLSATGHVSPGVLLAGAAAIGLGMSLGSPALSAMTPELVPRELVAEAIALQAVAYNIARAVGPAIGGFVLSGFGSTASFALNAATFVLVAVVVLASPLPRKRRVEAHPPLAHAFTEPLGYSLREEGIRSVMIAMMMFTTGASMAYGVVPAYGKQSLAASATQYGLMLGAMGLGALLVTRVLRPIRGRAAPRTLVAATAMTYALSTVAMSGAHSIRLAMVLFLSAGAGWTGTFSSLTTLVQLWTPDRLRARTIALYTVVHFATWAAGSSAGGLVAERWSIRAAVLLGGSICAIASIVITRLSMPSTFLGPPGSIRPPKGQPA